ncbi:hypothetical protein [Marixanthomonas ophiurae]|uniref:Universal stress protein n=1 Tax=Marixanthomonas ophiurae TaxID=387659 RepID=A0A3E1QDP7_9FLAO|nr:hypothetical protein [Marixanthomonas ophiurae]RFN60214.1 hypothetical protein DZ858_09285 [Marixanthomonas ophiurae]
MFAEKLEKMRKILIPTDFTVESLQLVEYAILNFPNTKLDIILIAGHKLPNTRWGITHFSSREQIRKQFTDEFVKAKQRLLVEHKQSLDTITCELFTGLNSIAFKNFMEKLGAENAIIPKDKVLQYPGVKWFDTTKFLKKNATEVVEVPAKIDTELSQKKYSFSSLFS